MLIQYISKRFSTASLDIIDRANAIIEEYQQQGFNLTLRQLFYQFVARGFLPNKQNEYSRLGKIISDARLAGEIDWDTIEDRTRFMRSKPHWEGPSHIIVSAAVSYHVDMWEGQKYRPEVWIEKDALIGVIEDVCNDLDTPHFACRGYVSQSELWRAGRRFKHHIANGQTPIIFHLGDHDPSGLDMTGDNRDRAAMFAEHGVEVRRLALNMDQVEEHNPPPNPAKLTDTRARAYIVEYGYESWELDALEPSLISDLIKTNINELIHQDLWNERETYKQQGLEQLQAINERWPDVVDFLGV